MEWSTILVQTEDAESEKDLILVKNTRRSNDAIL